MQHVSSNTIQDWERFYRANFINCLSGFKAVSLIGTVNKEGVTNLGVFSNIVHIGADPALVGFINRPVKAAPHTIANIESSGNYTINHIHAELVEKAHQASAKYPEDISEFEALQLTPEYLADFTAPFVKESRIKYALSLQEIIPIKLNGSFLVIGKIEHAFLDPEYINDDGFVDLSLAGSLCSGGIDAYYSTIPLARFSYAKTGVAPASTW